MDIVACISNVAKAIGSIFSFQSKKLEMKNTAQVQAAQQAQNEVSAVDKTKTAIAKQDVQEMRNELAE